MNFIRFVSVIIVFLAMSDVCSAGISAEEEALISYFQAGQKITAVQTDMAFYLGWRRLDRDEWKDPAIKANAQLEDVKRGLPATMPPQLEEQRAGFLRAVEALQTLYRGCSAKSDMDLQKEEDLFTRAAERFNDNLSELSKNILSGIDLGEDFDPLEEEIRSFPAKDRGRFLTAAAQLEEKNFEEAALELSQLITEYKGTSAEGSLAIRLARTVLGKNRLKEDKALVLAQVDRLQELLNSGVYYPNLADMYVLWRDMYQEHRHGISGTSIIPNHLYAATAVKVRETIEKYLRHNAKDDWAKVQIFIVAQTPMVFRGALSGPTPGVILPVYSGE